MSDVAQPSQSELDRLPWHHSIDFGNGIVSNGNGSLAQMRTQADLYFPGDLLSGKSFLDVGCWDGYNSFEAHRRGASRVLATDHFAWSDQCWGDRQSFELGRAHLAPSIEVRDIDLPDLSVDTVGHFDVVLFAGVFYHLRHPFAVLEQIAPIATECLIVETHLDAFDQQRPSMIFYPGAELANDPTNWWGPNALCVEAMLNDLGFPRVESKIGAHLAGRGVFHAHRGH